MKQKRILNSKKDFNGKEGTKLKAHAAREAIKLLFLYFNLLNMLTQISNCKG